MRAIALFIVLISGAYGNPTDRPRQPLAVEITRLEAAHIQTVLHALEEGKTLDLLTLCKALQSSQVYLRAQAATALGDLNDKRAIPFLIDALSDLSSHVGAMYVDVGDAYTRHRANKALKKLSGKDFGFVWKAAQATRDEAINNWIKWYREEIEGTLPPVLAAEVSPAMDTPDEAAARGRKAAALDVGRGRFRILVAGQPSLSPLGKDSATGWSLFPAAGCRVTPELSAEIEGYNKQMREEAQQRETSSPVAR